MIRMTLKELARAVGVEAPCGWGEVTVHRVATDSREVKPGDLFAAIEGERYDGRAFVEQAISKGAVAFMGRDSQAGVPKGGGKIPWLKVSDTVEALGRLAAYYRRNVMPRHTIVIAVTGSNGKTTTKRMIDHVLGQSLKGRSSPRSFNNHIGVPLTVLSGEADDRYLVAEIGTNSPGEVASLAALVSSDVAVITSIGRAHLAGLGDLTGVAAEKLSILEQLRPGGLAVVNTDAPQTRALLKRAGRRRLVTFGTSDDADLLVGSVRASLDRTVFDLAGRFRIVLPMPGVCHSINAAAAFAVARELGISEEEIVGRLQSFAPPSGRCRVLTGGGISLVDDTYNANPESMIAAVETLMRAGSGRRVLVIGDMYELGSGSAELHREVVAAVFRSGIEVLVAVGPQMSSAARTLQDAPGGPRVTCYEETDSAAEAVRSLLLPGDTVWVKASRAMQLDRGVAGITARYGNALAVA